MTHDELLPLKVLTSKQNHVTLLPVVTNFSDYLINNRPGSSQGKESR